MKLKAIVLDVDGTLINSENMILDATKDILIEAQELGIIVILASGRPSNGVKKYAEELKLDKYNGFIVSYNGGKVHQVATGKVLLDEKLEHRLSRNILKRAESFNVVPLIDNDEYLFTTDVYGNCIEVDGEKYNIVKSERDDNELKLCEIDRLYEYKESLNKILIASEPEYLSNICNNLIAPFKQEVNAEFSERYLLEISARNVDKAAGLKVVLDYLSIHNEDVIVFGDGENDISMFEYINYSVAMDNANDKVKKYAKKVTTSNENEGIKNILQKII